MTCGDTTYLTQRITRTQGMIAALEDAIEALSSEKIHSYDLDTGQNRSRVTKQELPRLIQELDRLDARLCRLNAKLENASGNLSVQVVPGW